MKKTNGLFGSRPHLYMGQKEGEKPLANETSVSTMRSDSSCSYAVKRTPSMPSYLQHASNEMKSNWDSGLTMQR